VFQDNYTFGKCGFFTEKENDHYLMTGVKEEISYYNKYCSTARSCEHLCGEEGKYYKRKYVKKIKNKK
jgi:hypothetical protein